MDGVSSDMEVSALRQVPNSLCRQVRSFMRILRNAKNLGADRGFVKKSATFSSVGTNGTLTAVRYYSSTDGRRSLWPLSGKRQIAPNGTYSVFLAPIFKTEGPAPARPPILVSRALALMTHSTEMGHITHAVT